MFTWSLLLNGLLQSVSTLLFLVLILLPIMITLEYIRHYQLLEKVSSSFRWLTNLLTLSPHASLPLIIGLFVGLFFGAAVIIEYSKEGLLSKRDLFLLGIFLAINHSIIEDNLLFTALGANLVVLLVVRFIMAFAITRSVAFIIDRSKHGKHGDGSPASKIQSE